MYDTHPHRGSISRQTLCGMVAGRAPADTMRSALSDMWRFGTQQL